MHCVDSMELQVSRRVLLQRAGGGLGLLALADLLHGQGLLGNSAAAANPLNDQRAYPNQRISTAITT